MSDLHARLVARCDDMASLQSYPHAYGRALRAVVELHAPKPYSENQPTRWLVCHGCDVEGYEWEHPEWPCSTIQAIARELGVNEGDDRG